VSTVVIDNMLKGFQDENTDPAKVPYILCLESDYTVKEHSFTDKKEKKIFLIYRKI
jgi:hypothetical protein